MTIHDLETVFGPAVDQALAESLADWLKHHARGADTEEVLANDVASVRVEAFISPFRSYLIVSIDSKRTHHDNACYPFGIFESPFSIYVQREQG